MRWVIFSLITTYFLNVIDYVQTIYGTTLLGVDIEGNPLVRLSLGNNWWLFKLLIVPVFLAVIGAILYKYSWLKWVAYFLLGFYTFVVINNFIVLAQMGALL